MSILKPIAFATILGITGLGISLSGPAQAAPMLVVDGGSNVVGISDLDIGGTAYDVAFFDAAASYNDVVAVHGAGHVFADTAEAALAETALAAFLNSETVSSVLPEQAQTILFRVGAIAPFMDLFFVPYSNSSSAWIDNPFLHTAFSPAIGFTPESPSDPSLAYALFSESSTAVPAPATSLVLGIGLFGIFIARRRGTV